MTKDLILDITLRLKGAERIANSPEALASLQGQFATALKMIAPMIPGGKGAECIVKARVVEDGDDAIRKAILDDKGGS